MSFSASANQFFDRLLTPPNSARSTLYSAMIDALVTAGTWDKIDGLWVFAASDSGTSLINLKSGSFAGFLHMDSGAPTFTANSGWSGNGASNLKSVDMNFNPSTAGGNYTQNDAMFSVWVLGSTAEAALQFGEPNSRIELYPKYTDNKTYWAINGNGAEIATANGAGPDGFWLVERTASNACALYKNNVSVATSSNGSAALVNASLVSDGVANTSAAVVIGGSLTGGQKTTLYSGLQTYLQGVGAI